MPAYRDEKSGTWFCKCYYTDWMGLRRQKWKRGFPTKREAKEFERNFLQRQSDSPEILFENLYRVYLEEMEVRLKPSTVLIKKNICESKILPYFGKKSVNEISAVEVRKWQNFLMKSEQKYSETYLKTIHNQLSAIMNYAKKFYNLKTNPCEQAGSIGSSRAETMQYWTLEEFLTFRESILDREHISICFDVLYWTGMRVGELLALTKEDIDFAKKEIRINKSYQRLKGEDIITTPKTKKSIRRVLIPDFLCEELKEFLRTAHVDEGKRIFPYSKGILNQEMKRGCRESGVKKIRVHDLRHSHVSLLINNGFDALVIAERVGHENVSTTLNTYAHLFPNKQVALAASLEQMAVKRVPEKTCRQKKKQ